jgi:Tfp pilus assembly protein PilV
MMKFLFKSQAGIGLIETLLTLLIIAGTAIALLRFQNYLAYSDNMTQQQADAIQLAINEIEILRDFTVLTGTNSYQNIASGSGSSVGVNTTYNLVWTITNNTSPNYKVINVTVSWTDRYGTSHSVAETSQVAGIDPSFSIAIM